MNASLSPRWQHRNTDFAGYLDVFRSVNFGATKNPPKRVWGVNRDAMKRGLNTN